MSQPTQAQYDRILKSAILAPSADNRHRFRLDPMQDALRLWYPKDEMPASGGYKRALVLLSLGAVSENITLEASTLGLYGSCALFPATSLPDLAVEIKWTGATDPPDPLSAFISARHTNRRPLFHGPSLSEAQLKELEIAANKIPGCHLLWLDEPDKRKQALTLIRLAETERFRNRLLHEELFSAIQFDAGWSTNCEEGLPPGALEVEKPLRPIFKLMRRWPVMRVLKLVGAHYMLGMRAGWLPCRLAPHLGVITVARVDDGGAYSAGRVFQRVWLAAVSLGLSLQPLPASAIYALKGAREENIPERLQRRLLHGWQAILPGQQPIVLFRIGRAAPPAVTAGRRPLRHYSLEAPVARREGKPELAARQDPRVGLSS